MATNWQENLVKLDDYRYMIPRSYKPGMQTDVIIYVGAALLESVMKDLSLEQAANLAFLPGIVGKPIVMPDVHQGYGFPIGGVAATDAENGVVSPAGIGFDINCGVRLLKSDLGVETVRPQLDGLVNDLFRAVPSGTGREGQISVSRSEMDNVLRLGAQWAVEQGYGREEDLEHIESRGCIPGAHPTAASNHAKSRGADQLGTLGSGNHFLEVQYVDEVFDSEAAQAFGLQPGQVTVLIHTGSRGFGHQVCTDYLKVLRSAMQKYNIDLPDKEMAATYINSPEGQDYLGAMNAAANFAFANRQMITHWVRGVFVKHFGDSGDLNILYDVAHNIAKFETHTIDGKERRVLVHRKGATRALPAGHSELHPAYRAHRHRSGRDVRVELSRRRPNDVTNGCEEGPRHQSSQSTIGRPRHRREIREQGRHSRRSAGSLQRRERGRSRRRRGRNRSARRATQAHRRGERMIQN
jgi:tRNA-splicing ligase RtcB